MKHLIDIKRLFSTYDKSNRSKTYIITKTIVLFLGLSVCAELFIAVCYFLLPSSMTNLVRTTAESLTINGVKSFSLKAWAWVIIIAPMMEETTHRLWLSMNTCCRECGIRFVLRPWLCNGKLCTEPCGRSNKLRGSVCVCWHNVLFFG